MSDQPPDLADLDSADPNAANGPDPADYLRFAVGATRRRKLLVLAVFLVGFAFVALVFANLTPMYRAEVRILALRQQALPAIARSNISEDQPTRAAWELIHRHDNLVELIKCPGCLRAR